MRRLLVIALVVAPALPAHARDDSIEVTGTVAATRSRWNGDVIVTDADVRDAAGQVTTVVQLGGTVDGIGMAFTDVPPVVHVGDAVALDGSGRAVLALRPRASLAPAGGAATYGVQRTDRSDHVLWRDSSCIDMVYDTQTIGDDAARALDAALATWSTATSRCGGVSLVSRREAVLDEQDGKSTVHIRTDRWCRPATASTPELCFSHDAAGVTRLVYIDNAADPDDGKILEADMELNAVDFALTPGAANGKPVLDLQAVATHEAGHVLGLAHDCGTGAETWPTDRDGIQVPACSDANASVLAATMYYRIAPGDTGARTPEASDTQGACALLAGESCQRYVEGGCASGGGGSPWIVLAIAVCKRRKAAGSRPQFARPAPARRGDCGAGPATWRRSGPGTPVAIPRRMKRLPTILIVAIATLAAACAGDAPTSSSTPPKGAMKAHYGMIDKNHDGKPDGLDLNGDGVPDIDIHALCDHPLVDTNGDGVPDGLDLDCDGTIDIPLCLDPLVDTNGDGVPDGIDLDCDGTIDIDLGTSCLPAPIDDNGDGVPDGLDTNCDGQIDVPFGGGSGSGSGGVCVPTTVDTNGDGVPDGIDLDCDGQADVTF